MVRQPTPNWQPSSRLPLIASMVDGMLGDAQQHYRTLRQAGRVQYLL